MIAFLSLFSLICLALIHLACSLSKHQKQIFKREINAVQSQILRYLGYLLMLCSLFWAILQLGTSVGISIWLGTLTLAAILITSVLSYMDQYLKGLAIILVFMIFSCTLIQIV